MKACKHYLRLQSIKSWFQANTKVFPLIQPSLKVRRDPSATRNQLLHHPHELLFKLVDEGYTNPEQILSTLKVYLGSLIVRASEHYSPPKTLGQANKIVSSYPTIPKIRGGAPETRNKLLHDQVRTIEHMIHI